MSFPARATIETARLILRQPVPRDVDAAVAFYVSERAQYSGGNVPMSHAFRNFASILGHWQIRGFGLWAITTRDSDAILGLAGPYYPHGWPETEIGYVLFDGAEGHGFATEAARATITDARSRLGWGEIVHYISPENARSIAVAERLGATLDPQAATPGHGKPCLVYRQPKPEAVS